MSNETKNIIILMLCLSVLGMTVISAIDKYAKARLIANLGCER